MDDDGLEAALLDQIDSVLADYVAGFAEWAVLTGHLPRNTADHLIATRPYINQISLGIELKHTE